MNTVVNNQMVGGRGFDDRLYDLIPAQILAPPHYNHILFFIFFSKSFKLFPLIVV